MPVPLAAIDRWVSAAVHGLTNCDGFAHLGWLVGRELIPDLHLFRLRLGHTVLRYRGPDVTVIDAWARHEPVFRPDSPPPAVPRSGNGDAEGWEPFAAAEYRRGRRIRIPPRSVPRGAPPSPHPQRDDPFLRARLLHLGGHPERARDAYEVALETLAPSPYLPDQHMAAVARVLGSRTAQRR